VCGSRGNVSGEAANGGEATDTTGIEVSRGGDARNKCVTIGDDDDEEGDGDVDGAIGGSVSGGGEVGDVAEDGFGCGPMTGSAFNKTSSLSDGQNESIVFQESSHMSCPYVSTPGLNTPDADITNNIFFNDSGTASASNSLFSAFIYTSIYCNTVCHSLWKSSDWVMVCRF
jgi:hypothetical protein